MIIEVKCDECNKEFQIEKKRYNERLKRNKKYNEIFCSPQCGTKARKRRSILLIKCINCNNEFQVHKFRVNRNLKRDSEGNFCSRKCFTEYFKIKKTVNDKLVEIKCDGCNKITTITLRAYKDRRRNKSNFWYCTLDCARKNKIVTEDTKEMIKKAQEGVSVKSRGRIGHIVSEETREKIRQKRLKQIKDMKIKQYSFHLIHECMKNLGESKYVITNGVVPDAIYTKNNKLIAVESERGAWVSCATKKMESYDTKPHNFDEVHVFWLDSKNRDKIAGHWYKSNGSWQTLI